MGLGITNIYKKIDFPVVFQVITSSYTSAKISINVNQNEIQESAYEIKLADHGIDPIYVEAGSGIHLLAFAAENRRDF